MKEKGNKSFVLNVIIDYYENTNPDNYREPIYSIFKNLAWLHGLDYSMESNTKILHSGETEEAPSMDIIYLRSSQHTHISLREFQNVIDGIFLKSLASPFSRVNVFYQNQVFTEKFPFPVEFYRPMNYPYIELHNGLQKELFVYRNALGPDLNLVPNLN